MFWTYYLVCLAYCMIMSFRRWNRDVMAGGLGISPGLDTLGIVIMAPILAPVDIFLTWLRIYREAEEARRRGTKRKLTGGEKAYATGDISTRLVDADNETDE